MRKHPKLQVGQSLSILFNYNTSEVVVSLSVSRDSLLVMVIGQHHPQLPGLLLKVKILLRMVLMILKRMLQPIV